MKKKIIIKPKLLLETIQVKNGEIRNLEYHNRRFNSSRREMFGVSEEIDLGKSITVPFEARSGLYRCRVLYRHDIDEIQFIAHEVHPVRSLKLVYHDDIDYSLKYADREELMLLFGRKGDCDEILIVKDGFITDTSISNIVFRRSDNVWLTPDTPLLNGTMRMNLLESGRIIQGPVRPSDLPGFTGARMINCMMPLESSPTIEMDQIFD